MKRFLVGISLVALLVIGATMATHDIGRNDQRTDAKPNIHDVLSENKADGTQGITQFVNQTARPYVLTKDAHVVANDGTYNVVELGRLADGTYGLKVAKPGFDVYSATNSQLIFNSGQNTFKIIGSGSTTVTATTGAAADTSFQVDVPHGLSFRPAVLAFVTTPAGVGGSLEQIPYYFHLYDVASTSFQVRAMARIYIDDTNVSFYVRTNNGAPYAGSWVFKYYLLQETAN